MLSHNYEFYLVITSYWPCGLPYLRAIRYYLEVHKFCTTLALFGEIGWYPHQIILQINIIRYWNKLIKSR